MQVIKKEIVKAIRLFSNVSGEKSLNLLFDNLWK